MCLPLCLPFSPHLCGVGGLHEPDHAARRRLVAHGAADHLRAVRAGGHVSGGGAAITAAPPSPGARARAGPGQHPALPPTTPHPPFARAGEMCQVQASAPHGTHLERVFWVLHPVMDLGVGLKAAEGRQVDVTADKGDAHAVLLGQALRYGCGTCQSCWCQCRWLQDRRCSRRRGTALGFSGVLKQR